MKSTDKLILSQAAAHLVDAYKLVIQEYESILPLDLRISVDAPSSYAGLKANARQGILSVTSAHSDTSIYGVAGNVTFRTFHDYGHLLYARQFIVDDEIFLAQTQWLDLKKYIPAEWVSVCHVVYFADTCEQSRFEAKTGAFPVDQKTFCLGFLVDFLGKWNTVHAYA
jgi:hypothetical protein